MIVCAAVGAGTAPAQVRASGERTITGVVVDSVSGKPLRNAVLYFTGGGGEETTGRDGRFRIEHVSSGDTLLVARSIGYVPAVVRVPVSLSAAVIDVGQVKIGPVATRLDQVAVEAEEVRLFPQLADFYRRKQQGGGAQFFTREDVERAGVRRTSELLYRSKNLEMDCPHDPVRAGDDRCVPRDRRGLDYKVTQGVTSRCEKEIFVDGRLSMFALDETPVDQIAAIEVYAGPATTPAIFGQRRCGVVAIWTRGSARQ